MGALASFIVLNNTSLSVARSPGEPVLLAHRGVAQRFDIKDLRADTCTAARMLPPRHDFLENTLPSIKAAFALGADVVEIDVQPTTDGKFAVFHDWTLDCRTDGYGVTRQHSLAELKALDVGYGYTSDGGRTFPFRGKGRGMMPSLGEVFAAFPGRDFLINVKSNDPHEGELLARRLSVLPPERRARLMVYGGDRPIEALSRNAPDIRAMSRASLKSCLLRYMLYGWTGILPAACRQTLILIPINVAPWLWGWPKLFLNRMEGAGSRVFAQGAYYGGWSAGIDSKEDLARLPAGYSGGILTNEIEIVARATLGK
jgi:glycerophosphoryl diester phosphodiesterase